MAKAEKDLLRGRADAAAAGLTALLAADRTNGEAHLLLCRVYSSEELLPEAAAECQAALADGLRNNSAAQDWTGRALGHQAEHAGPLAGLKLALQVKNAFETAVDLDPRNEAACIDLGEYYSTAPAIVGGGTGKARALADRIQAALPAVAHRIRAMSAEKEKDLATATAEFQAEAAATRTPGALIDLAAFYDRHGAHDKAIATVRDTLAADRMADATLPEAASILEDQQQTQLAEETLRRYLVSGAQSDAAPVFRVHAFLGDILARAGDKNGAREQYMQALALASRYAPAQKGLAGL